ncbi:hypothetical protein DM860_010083 [Cuscuta australis]|uniref:Uncharacterized protein n=1 Tax=Cuscuta australis TaxID=267555 RepID=A0A328DAD8_9ASTE|nr:hypothetical protein DM860_010083 [Cuscuta australis]
MGGGGGDHGHHHADAAGDFRSKVWTMTGGPNCRPVHWKRNTAIAMAGIVLVCIPIAMKSAQLENIGFPSMFRTYPSLVSQFSFRFEVNGHLPIEWYKLPIAGWEVDFQTRKESTLNDLQRSWLPIDGLPLPSLGSHRWDRFPIAGQGAAYPSMGRSSHRWVGGLDRNPWFLP